MKKSDEIIEEIKEELKLKNIEIDEVRKKIDEYLKFGVPPEQIKQEILSSYGIQGNTNKSSVYPDGENAGLTTIRELSGEQKNLNLLCRVVSVNKRENEVEGKKKTSFYGLLEDGTGVIGFTAWEDFELVKGDALKITNAYTRVWQDRIRIYLGNYTTVEEIDPSEIPKGEIKYFQINELKTGLRNIEIKGRILTLKKREVLAKGEKKIVLSGTIADESGRIDFTGWGDLPIREGETYRIRGAGIRSWRNIPQVSFDETADIEKFPENLMIPNEEKELSGGLAELEEKVGGFAIVKGTIIDVREGSGIIFRCPECKRVLKNGSCSLHGEVKGISDFRIKAVIDDGTSAITAIFDRNLTEKLTGKTLDEFVEDVKESMDYRIAKKMIEDKILMKTVILKGTSIKDDWGITFMVRDVEDYKINLKKELEKLR
jgi:replication factor A1